MSDGKVYVVGAGPGDPGLVTLRARELLSKADVVVYDRLVDRRVLELAPKRARLVYAGKGRGESGKQEAINALLVSEASKGRVVVRLKGGDPSLFGRGGEELQALAREGIAYEVVPGVTSALAAAAYAGFPLTHRDYSSSVFVATGQERAGSEGRVDWRRAALSADTIVIMMGASTFPRIALDLLAGGLQGDTPVAAIRRATTSGQTVSLFTLNDFASDPPKISPPSIIVVGRVASLARELDWFRVRGRTTQKRSPGKRLARAQRGPSR